MNRERLRAKRPRCEVHPLVLWAVNPVLRYSAARDAYVLRVVGQSVGAGAPAESAAAAVVRAC